MSDNDECVNDDADGVQDAGSASTEAVEPEKVTVPRSRTAATGWTRRLMKGWMPIAVLAAMVVALAVSTGVLGSMYVGRGHEIAEAQQRVSTDQEAQKVAIDYATGAAMMNYQDVDTWKSKLIEGTAPKLSKKLTDAATSMEQVIVPLQWVSTAEPIGAQVTGRNGSIYTVAAFVNVTTKSTQAPDGVQSTATYTITLDRSNNWQITDVGGVDPLAPK